MRADLRRVQTVEYILQDPQCDGLKNLTLIRADEGRSVSGRHITKHTRMTFGGMGGKRLRLVEFRARGAHLGAGFGRA